MTDPPARPKRPRRWARLFGLALLALILIPPLTVLTHRLVGPPMTFLMVERMAAGDGMRRDWRPLSRISPNLVYAAIAAEDANFCRHRGFDLKAIEQALKDNKRRPNRLRGGSTISQQTAKNVFLWSGRGWVRKGFEAGYTVLIEALWGKPRTMEVYLNVVEWGPGIYGAEAASQHWFGVSAENLSPRQAAGLAAILPSPRKWKAAQAGPYVRRRVSRIHAAMGTVRNDGLATCVIRPKAKAEPKRKP